ncbi:MAG: hypothetical protein JXE06_10570 [Coriobacteriia bacterium]|nr:hypothetical protein [Coriobacteriia bacterium]MBN2822814.1 hypothetical protein [Coriobacteriia bacterium]
MTRSVSKIAEEYLSRLRAELVAAGAEDTEETIAEIHSLLMEAGEEGPEAMAAAVIRLGDPAELARGILAERGLDPAAGMSTGLWWRLGIAAPIDIALGVALPLAAAIPLYVVALSGQPRVLSIAISLVLAAAVLMWPAYIWRPWMEGGRVLSPGMTLAGLAVVRAPGFWRVLRIEDLSAMGLVPRRRVISSLIVVLVGAALLVGVTVMGLDVGGSWLSSAAISTEFSGDAVGGGLPLETQLQFIVEQVYFGSPAAPEAEGNTALLYLSPEGSLELGALLSKVAEQGIVRVRVGDLEQITPGVYRFTVSEYSEENTGSPDTGTSTFTVGRRQWLLPEGTGSDWVVVDIQP